VRNDLPNALAVEVHLLPEGEARVQAGTDDTGNSDYEQPSSTTTIAADETAKSAKTEIWLGMSDSNSEMSARAICSKSV
jgi:hypothetical protein